MVIDDVLARLLHVTEGVFSSWLWALLSFLWLPSRIGSPQKNDAPRCDGHESIYPRGPFDDQGLLGFSSTSGSIHTYAI